MTRSLIVLVNSERVEHARLRDELALHHAGPVVIAANDPSSRCADADLLLMAPGPSDWMMALPQGEKQHLLQSVFLLRGFASGHMFSILEEFQLAGGIDTLSLSHWSTPSGKPNGYGVCGRREVVATIGAKLAGDVFASEHYAMYGSLAATTLPQAIVEYLDALARVRAAST